MVKVMRLVVVVLCVIVLCVFMVVLVVVSRKMSGEMVFVVICVFCIFMMELLLMVYEGRYECVYSLINGYKVVGVGYDLDDDKDIWCFEFSIVFVDYDKVCWLCLVFILMNGK